MTFQSFRTLPHWLNEKGFFHLLAANFLLQSLGFGSQLLVAKFLTPIQLGEVRILQTYTGWFMIVAGFGLSTSVLKFCAENRTKQDKEFILRSALIRVLIATLVTLLLLAVLSLLGLITTSRYFSLWLLIYASCIPFSVVTSVLMVYLQALKQIKEMAKTQAIIRVQSFLVIVLCTWLWGFRGFVFSTIAAYVVGLIPLLKQVGLHFLSVSEGIVPAGFAGVAVFSMLANSVSALGQSGDILILDHFTTDRTAIGYYSLALMFVMAAMQITGTVQSIVTPYFSERANDEGWVKSQIGRNQMRMSLLSVVVAIAVFLGAKMVVSMLYGPSYSQAMSYLAILLLKYVVWSSYAVIGPAFVGLGLMRYNFAVVAISTPIGLALSYGLLQVLGVQGVAWAQVASALVTLVLVLGMKGLALRKFYAPSGPSMATRQGSKAL